MNLPRSTECPKPLLQPASRQRPPAADHSLILIDLQSQMAFATKSIEMIGLRNNCWLTPAAN
jgi:hypothetical protein